MLFNSYRSSLLKYTFQYESIDTRLFLSLGREFDFNLGSVSILYVYIYIWNSREIDLFFFFFFLPLTIL